MNTKVQSKIKNQRARRVRRVRSKIKGDSKRPRLAVHRSLKYLSAQIIDDMSDKTLVAVHQRDLGKKKIKSMDVAAELGKQIAEKAKKAGVETVVFDRRQYKYHGRVKAFANAAREAGLKF